MSKKDISKITSRANTRLVKKDSDGNILSMIEKKFEKDDSGELKQVGTREYSAKEAKKIIKEEEENNN